MPHENIRHMKCTVAVSGGSDSLYALLYLREEGWNVHALHALFLPSATAGGAARDLADLCAGLGIPFETLDLSKAFFRSVMEPFAMEHARARTPNPCALCNRAMKFGLLLEHALQDGGMYATGHFASMQEHPVYGMTLRAAAYAPKDQSYFLSLVPIEKLRRCIFPLAGISKPDARAWLARRGYSVPLPSESQEICFIPGDNHCAWLEQWQRKRMINLPGPGPVLLARTGQVIARHSGLWRYTEGQRRGLGIACHCPQAQRKCPRRRIQNRSGRRPLFCCRNKYHGPPQKMAMQRLREGALPPCARSGRR